MNIIYGLVSLDQKKIDHSIQSIKSSLLEYNPVQSKEVVQSNYQFAAQTFTEVQPENLLYSENHCFIVSNSRIDNKEEIYKHLAIEPNNAIPDNVLLLQMYLQFGEAFVKKIEGNWTLAIWNENNQELFIARDSYGLSAIYYRLCNKYIAFSTLLKGLVDWDKENLRINGIYFASIMSAWNRMSHETAFEQIFCLPPAHYLKVKNGKISLTRYWEVEKTPELLLDSEDAYVYRFSRLLDNAVYNRIKNSTNIATQLSSGFDSSTVTTVASELVKKQGKSLVAFTSVPKENTSDLFSELTNTNESNLSILTSKFLGNVDNQIINSENASIIQNLKLSIDIHQSPIHAAGNMYWIHEIYQEAQKLEIDTMLIGQSGNATISWTGYPEGFHLKTFIKRMIGFPIPEKLTVSSYFLYIVNQLKAIIQPSKSKPWESYAFINQQFAEDIQLESLMKEAGHDPTFMTYKVDRNMHIDFINPIYSKIGNLWQDLSYYYHIPTYDPTSDKHIVEFCLSVPNQYFHRYNTPKWLIKEAMKGRLLDELIHQKKKGRQATDLSIKVSEESEEFKQLLESFKGNKTIEYYLDIQKIEECLQRIVQNPRSRTAYMDAVYLTRAINGALFVQKFGERLAD